MVRSYTVICSASDFGCGLTTTEKNKQFDEVSRSVGNGREQNFEARQLAQNKGVAHQLGRSVVAQQKQTQGW